MNKIKKLITLQNNNGNWEYYHYSTINDLRRIIANIDNGTLIGHNVKICDKAQIGQNCVLKDNTVINTTAVITANTVINKNFTDEEILEESINW